MEEYSIVFKVISTIAVFAIIGFMVRMAGITPSVVFTNNNKRKNIKNPRKRARETFYKDREPPPKDAKGKVWQDDNLYAMKEAKEGKYKGDGGNKKKGTKYESWDDY